MRNGWKQDWNTTSPGDGPQRLIVTSVCSPQPGNSEALHLLGVLAHQQGKHSTAIDLIRAAICVEPQVANYHLNLGAALQARDEGADLAEAIQCYEAALEIDDRLALAHNNLGNAFRQFGRLPEALAHFQRALEIEPDQTQVLSNLGSLWIEYGDFKQAQSVLARLLQISPHHPEGLCNQAIIEARQALTAEAIELYQRGLRQQPNLLSAWNNLGQLLSEQGAVVEVQAAFRQVVRLSAQPFRQLKAATVCPVIPQSVAEICDYRNRLAEQIEAFQATDYYARARDWESSGLNPPFHLPYHGLNDRDLKSGWAQLFARSLPQLELTRRSGQAHVAFVVADRHVPVFWKFVGGFLQHLPKSDLKLSVVGSAHSQRELAQHGLSPEVEFVTIRNQLTAAAETLQQVRPDVLFHFEPEANAFNYFLAHLRLAPIQCTSWGIPVTSGIPAMTDYLSCQSIEPTDAGQHYCERLTRFQRLPVYFQRPGDWKEKSRESFGFRDHDRLYGCPHSLFKFHPDFDEVLSRILTSDPNAKIVLVEGRQAYWTDLLKRRLRPQLQDTLDRVVFLPPQSASDFRSLLTSCDVLLDPFPFGGGATTYEAMWVGKPTVTLPGKFMRGRVTLGCWLQTGISECIAATKEDYVNKAIQIANEPDLQQALQLRILAAHDLLFADQAAASELRDWFLNQIAASRGA